MTTVWVVQHILPCSSYPITYSLLLRSPCDVHQRYCTIHWLNKAHNSNVKAPMKIAVSQVAFFRIRPLQGVSERVDDVCERCSYLKRPREICACDADQYQRCF